MNPTDFDGQVAVVTGVPSENGAGHGVGIRINAVCPGAINTPMGARRRERS